MKISHGTQAVILLAVFTAGYLTPLVLEKGEMPLVHKLEQPLLLFGGGSDSPPSLLPTGTSLYFDEAFPEGFVRYKVYVNVEGINLNTEETSDKFWLSPLTAVPIDKDELKTLLTDYPLTKDDLAKILKSGHLTKQDIRELLMEYSE